MNQRNAIDDEIAGLAIRFPNGMVKKTYITTFQLPADKISNVCLDGAEELGLQFSMTPDGKCSLSGTPEKVGDFTLTLRYRTLPGIPESAISFPIAFNPNPRDLWTNIPTPVDTPFFKPDSESELVKVMNNDGEKVMKSMVAASQRGRSHAREGRPRDDHFSLFHCPDSQWYIMAVADGAGSAKFSRKGSQLACDAVIGHCKALLLDNPDFEQAIENYNADREDKEKRTALTRHVIEVVYNGAMKAHEAVKREALANEEASLKDFATTLMFAVCKKFDFGWFVASFWVGDGAICLFDENGKSAKLLGTPDEGEFSGQTRFLTMPEIFRDPDVVAKRLRIAIVPDFTALFLMTDGVSDPMFETERNLNSFAKWEEFYSSLRQGFPNDNIEGVKLDGNNDDTKVQLLKWLDFWSPGNHDDRTIAILY